jgi:molybdate transport system substrate-binding protein
MNMNNHQAISRIKSASPVLSKSLNISILFISLILLFACGQPKKSQPDKEKVTIFAPASMIQVMTEIIPLIDSTIYIKIEIQYASSGNLARQIEQGNLPDLFISASTDWTDYLRGSASKPTLYDKELISNQLALIGKKDFFVDSFSRSDLPHLVKFLSGSRLSIGDPSHVPVGMYARESLMRNGIWEEIKPFLLLANDAQTALMYVEMGEANLGIVYFSQVINNPNIDILYLFSSDDHVGISYGAMAFNENNSTVAVYQLLKSTAFDSIWSKHGFSKSN